MAPGWALIADGNLQSTTQHQKDHGSVIQILHAHLKTRLLARLGTLTFIVVRDRKLKASPQYISDLTEDSFKLH